VYMYVCVCVCVIFVSPSGVLPNLLDTAYLLLPPLEEASRDVFLRHQKHGDCKRHVENVLHDESRAALPVEK